jgi:hypothetical protein
MGMFVHGDNDTYDEDHSMFMRSEYNENIEDLKKELCVRTQKSSNEVGEALHNMGFRIENYKKNLDELVKIVQEYNTIE